MNINKLFPSKYLKADDLNGKPYTLTIRQMRVEQLGHGKEQETKPILYFEGAEKGLVLNRTNAMIIASLYTPETDNWSGQRVTLYATRVKAFGEMHDAIRVKQERPAQPVRQEPTPAMQAAVIDDADDVLDYEEDAPLPTRTAAETFGADDDDLTADEASLLAQLGNSVMEAQAWAVSIGACKNAFEAQNSWKKMLDTAGLGPLTRDAIPGAILMYIRKQNAKLAEPQPA